jgi:argininosuccinate lyase
MLSVLPGFTYELHFRFERMREAAQRGYLNAMAAATYLAGKGVPFRTAHEKIGNSVRYALEKGVELGDLTLDELRAFGPEIDEDFYAAVTLNATLDCHDVTGGTARGRVRTALDLAAKRIAELTAQNAVEAVHAGA